VVAQRERGEHMGKWCQETEYFGGMRPRRQTLFPEKGLGGCVVLWGGGGKQVSNQQKTGKRGKKRGGKIFRQIVNKARPSRANR